MSPAVQQQRQQRVARWPAHTHTYRLAIATQRGDNNGEFCFVLHATLRFLSLRVELLVLHCFAAAAMSASWPRVLQVSRCPSQLSAALLGLAWPAARKCLNSWHVAWRCRGSFAYSPHLSLATFSSPAFAVHRNIWPNNFQQFQGFSLLSMQHPRTASSAAPFSESPLSLFALHSQHMPLLSNDFPLIFHDFN